MPMTGVIRGGFKLNKKGSQIVEASIFLPILIIAVLAIGYIIRIVGIQECVHSIMVDELRRTSMLSYTKELGLAFKFDVEKRLKEEVPRAEDFRVDYYDYLHEDADEDLSDLIRVRASYTVVSPLTLGFSKGVSCSEVFLVRGFTGRGKPEILINSNEDAEDEIVWVFPNAGECYHSHDCSYTKVNPKERILTSSLRSEYKPCALCKPGSLANGERVYCFHVSGKVFHRENCSCVKRYVVSMKKSEAKEEGYRPCQKCGG